MAIGGAFLGGGVEVVPAGSCKLELEILTEDRNNLTATFTIRGTSTYTVTAGADGRAVYTVPAGQTYTVSVNTTGYDNLTSQTVVAESGTVRYVRFEAFEGRVKRSGDTMSGLLHLTGGLLLSTTPDKAVTDVPIFSTIREIGVDTVDSYQVSGSINMHWSGWTYSGGVTNWRDATHTAIDIVSESKAGSQTRLTIWQPNDGSAGFITYPSWSVGTNDNSDKVLTIAMANGLPSLVHTDRDEVIQGTKVFNGVISTGAFTIYGNDSIGRKQIFTRPYGNAAQHQVGWLIDNNLSYCAINIIANLTSPSIRIGNQNITAYATAPSSTAKGDEIATANWSIGKFVQKSGDTMTGGLAMQFLTVVATLDKNTTKPNATTNALMTFKAQDGRQLGGIANFTQASGNRVTYMKTVGIDGTTEKRLDIWHMPDNTAYLIFPSWSIGTDDNSDKILTIAMANGLPSLVHTSNDEVIHGVKTFKEHVYLVKASDGQFIIQTTDVVRGTAPKANTSVGRFRITDGANATFGEVYSSLGTDGSSTLTLAAIKNQTSRADAIIVLGWDANGKQYATAPSTQSNANSNEIATADWVNNKLAQKSKVTNVTSYAQLIELIKNGKRGDSFGLTMDYTGSAFGGITVSGVETHVFGHYTLEELTVTDGTLSSFQAFGSGEVSGKFVTNDNTTYTYATTGFGRAVVLQGYGDAFRVVEDGELTYFLTDDETTTSFDGYYISI